MRTLFVKDFKDNVFPVQFFLNFYYTSRFSYSLILHMDPITQFNYVDTTMIPIKHCMYFLCDKDNIVKNMSANCRKVLGLTHQLVKEKEELFGRPLKMEDIIVQLGVFEFIDQNGAQYIPKEHVKLRVFTDPNMCLFIACSLTYEEVVYLKDHPG